MSEQVREMFATIAPRYDLANQVLSFGTHHSWRRRTVLESAAASGARVLDCATGTGDLAFGFQRVVGNSGDVVGTDFCAPMLVHAREKAAKAGLRMTFEQADALALPYPRASFDVASIAFGIRNVDDPRRCLEEMARVVKKGGKVVVLEFGQPSGLFGALYRFYSAVLMPWIGGLLTGNRAAFTYLPRTAAAFPSGEQFLALMKETGCFSSARACPLTFGVAFIYVGTVAGA